MTPNNALKLGLIGNGIARTRSGDLHRLLGDLTGFDTSYELIDLELTARPATLADTLASCRARGFRGVNVTRPYKQEAFALVAPSRSLPRGLRSINTVLFESGSDVGDNTDHSGFCRAFRATFGSSRKPGRVLQLGAGGVGVALAFGLAELGAEEILVSDIRADRARSLVGDLARAGIAARLVEGDIVAAMAAADGLVNATPIGMYQYPGNPFPRAGLGRQSWVFDAVYTPERTDLLEAAGACGVDTLSGFELFFYQGLDAFERFSGCTVDAETALAAFMARHSLGDTK